MAGQMEVLNDLDVAKTRWWCHFTSIIIAGMGFFTDAYDLFCISIITKLIGRIYYRVDRLEKPGTLPLNVSAAINVVAICGTVLGQLSSAGSGLSLARRRYTAIRSGLPFGSTAKSVMATLCFFRFWVGFGIGGNYPLSATIMSEYANKKTRGAFIATVFAMQGFAILTLSPTASLS